MANKKSFKRFVLLVFLLVTGIFGYAADVEFPPVQSLCYFPYSDNSTLRKGIFTLGADLHYSNLFMFNHDRTTLNDYEALSVTLAGRYGLTDRLVLEMYYRHTSLSGGFLDKFIEDFHSAFGLPDNNRPEFPRNAVLYRYKDYFFYDDNTSASSPIIVALMGNLYQGRGLSLKSRFSVGVPISNKPGLSSKKPFFSLGLILSYEKKWFGMEFSNYLAFIKTPTWLENEQLQGQVFCSRLELRASRFLGGVIFRSSPYKEDDIAHNAYQAYFGYRISRFVDFLIIEDFKPFDTTPDATFCFRFRILRSR